LAQLAVSELEPARGGAVFTQREARGAPFATSLAAAMASPEHAVWVGTLDDVALGYAVAHTEPLRDGSVLAVIEDLFVEREAREVGVGEALAGAVIAWASEAGCRGIDAYALPG